MIYEPGTEEFAAFCLRIHYHLMENKRFWYEKGLMDASKFLCVAASDIRSEIRRSRTM